MTDRLSDERVREIDALFQYMYRGGPFPQLHDGPASPSEAAALAREVIALRERNDKLVRFIEAAWATISFGCNNSPSSWKPDMADHQRMAEECGIDVQRLYDRMNGIEDDAEASGAD